MYDLIRVPLGTADANELFSKANLGNDPFRSISGFPRICRDPKASAPNQVLVSDRKAFHLRWVSFIAMA